MAFLKFIPSKILHIKMTLIFHIKIILYKQSDVNIILFYVIMVINVL
jgi:hypothetical protein